jgi:hypothetical protein
VLVVLIVREREKEMESEREREREGEKWWESSGGVRSIFVMIGTYAVIMVVPMVLVSTILVSDRT